MNFANEKIMKKLVIRLKRVDFDNQNEFNKLSCEMKTNR